MVISWFFPLSFTLVNATLKIILPIYLERNNLQICLRTLRVLVLDSFIKSNKYTRSALFLWCYLPLSVKYQQRKWDVGVSICQMWEVIKQIFLHIIFMKKMYYKNKKFGKLPYLELIAIEVNFLWTFKVIILLGFFSQPLLEKGFLLPTIFLLLLYTFCIARFNLETKNHKIIRVYIADLFLS